MASWLGLSLYIFFPILFSFLVVGPSGSNFQYPLWRGLLFLLSVGLGVLALRRWRLPDANAISWAQHSTAAHILLTALLYATIYKLATFLPEVSTYPLSLGWSEASRYYNASLFFAQRLYGVWVSPPVLHPTRYLMQAFPFLFGEAPLWFHRLWQVLLWWGFSLMAGAAIAFRLRLRRAAFLGMVLWVVLSVFQGPVYYHLLVMVILVVVAFDPRHPTRSALVVGLASLWAGISRINWFPMPGLLATAIYLLEQPVARQTFWRYLRWPASWFVGGTLLAFLSQRTYIFLSGNPVDQFASSFHSDLLWYRLLPNPTYPLGVLPACFLAFGGVVLSLIVFYFQRHQVAHPLRWLGLATILGILLAGGIVVSVKIGGGSNLHNLDAFLVMLILIAAYSFAGRFQPEVADNRAVLPFPAVGLVGLACLAPLAFALFSGGAFPRWDAAVAWQAVSDIQAQTQRVTNQGQEVLFINQRHLLTFDEVTGVPLVPEYELVFLMEMVMSGNQSYLDAFQQDLQKQRFGLIVVESLSINYQGRNRAFGEENDAWVSQVSKPVLCYYEVIQSFDPIGVVLMAPRRLPCR